MQSQDNPQRRIPHQVREDGGVRSNKHQSYPTTRKHPHNAAMINAAKNIAIEKNRAALLRLVRFWLMIAALFGADRTLPRRIGLWVADIIFTAEQAAYYLQIASGYVQTSDAMPVQQYGPITIKAVIKRLKEVKKALIRLKPKNRAVQKRQHRFHPNSHLGESYMRGGLRIAAVSNCRAPPAALKISCINQLITSPS